MFLVRTNILYRSLSNKNVARNLCTVRSWINCINCALNQLEESAMIATRISRRYWQNWNWSILDRRKKSQRTSLSPRSRMRTRRRKKRRVVRKRTKAKLLRLKKSWRMSNRPKTMISTMIWKLVMWKLRRRRRRRRKKGKNRRNLPRRKQLVDYILMLVSHLR